VERQIMVGTRPLVDLQHDQFRRGLQQQRWVFGPFGTRHYNGTSWKVYHLPYSITTATAASSGDIWAVGAMDPTGTPGTSGVVRRDVNQRAAVNDSLGAAGAGP
jgi:hypothetical protein